MARPFFGKTVGTLAMVTSVPPARTSAVERSRISPPITSNATSTSPASSSLSACRSTKASTPKPIAVSRSAARPVPITRALTSRASCTAIEPTPPAAPWRRVLELRYGLGDEHPRTLDDVGRTFNVTRERIRQIEGQALKKLQNIREAQQLRDDVEIAPGLPLRTLGHRT